MASSIEYVILNESSEVLSFVTRMKYDQRGLNSVLDILASCRCYNASQREEIIKEYIDSDTKEIDFNRIAILFNKEENSEEALHNILEHISKRASKISKFCYFEEKFSYLHSDIKEVKDDDFILMALCNMKTLKEIQINKMSFPFSKIQKICKELEKLEILNVYLPCDETLLNENLECYKTDFHRLREFRFYVVWCKEHAYTNQIQMDLTQFCVQHLPNLEYIGCVNFFVDMVRGCMEYKGAKQSKLKRLDIGVNNIHFMNKEELANIFGKFPDIEYLRIKWSESSPYRAPSEFKLKNLKFKKVKQLMLLQPVYSAYFENSLMYYGKKLTELHVVHNGCLAADMKFAFIQKFCPNLKLMKILDITELTPDATWSMHKFAKLKELVLRMHCGQSFKPIDFYSILKGIIAAPNIQRIVLHDFSVDQSIHSEALQSDIIGLEVASTKLRRLDFKFKMLLDDQCINDASIIERQRHMETNLSNLIKKTHPSPCVTVTLLPFP